MRQGSSRPCCSTSRSCRQQATGSVKASVAAQHDSAASQAFHEVLAHGSARGFLTAAIFAVVAIVVTITMITTGKDEVADAETATGRVH